MNGKSGQQEQTLILSDYEAAILDMDGVITDTARAHAAAWKRMFDEYLESRAAASGETFIPFDDQDDYYRYVDGKPRYEGAESFLKAREIAIPYGNPEDPPKRETVCGLANRKNRYFGKFLQENEVKPYPDAVEFIKKLHQQKIKTAAISSSRNAYEVLASAGVTGLFEVIIDGKYSDSHNLSGKPEPDIFLEAARQLGVSPSKTMVIEDAISGIEAARKGGFALAVAIDRSGKNREIGRHGADVVLDDFSRLGNL